MSSPDIPLGGRPVVVLRTEGPGVCEATVAPGRGMLLVQARVREAGRALSDLLVAPPLEALPGVLDGGPEDFAGNAAFSLGGAILLPYANRIRGRAVPDAREIVADLDGTAQRLPRNWGGKAPGAEQYAMHGLMLAQAFDDLHQPDAATLTGRLRDWDFGGWWPGQADVEVTWRLADGALELSVQVANRGQAPLPLGVGWHPWFALPSGDRRQARLRLPAARRLEVNDYDEVLPTGAVLENAGGPFDFRSGAALGDLYLDDCFVDLERNAGGELVVEVEDPAAGRGVRLTTTSPGVQAVQVYAPPDRPLICVEPQFNWADPFGRMWPASLDTGIQRLPPGGSASYVVRTEVYAAEA
jgi:aldose 1-epimerase